MKNSTTATKTLEAAITRIIPLTVAICGANAEVTISSLLLNAWRATLGAKALVAARVRDRNATLEARALNVEVTASSLAMPRLTVTANVDVAAIVRMSPRS